MTRRHDTEAMSTVGEPKANIITRGLDGLGSADLGTAIAVWLCLALAAAVVARLWLGLSAEVARVLVAGLLAVVLALCLGMGTARDLQR
ncbi:MAG: hypothetical protein ACYC4L_04230 [Chloroflexota bacterium]